MFRIIFGRWNDNGWLFEEDVILQIEGCPDSGVAAIDWRRQHGLPPEPSNYAALKPLAWEDEATARRIGNLDDGADYRFDHHAQKMYSIRQSGTYAGQVFARFRHLQGGLDLGRLIVGPAPIVAYLAAESDEDKQAAAVQIIEAIREYSSRSKSAVEAEAAATLADKEARSSAMVEARELLKGELAEKDRQIKYLTGEVESLESRIESLEEDVAIREEVEEDA